MTDQNKRADAPGTGDEPAVGSAASPAQSATDSTSESGAGPVSGSRAEPVAEPVVEAVKHATATTGPRRSSPWATLLALLALAIAAAVAVQVFYLAPIAPVAGDSSADVAELRHVAGANRSQLDALEARLADQDAGRRQTNDELEKLASQVARQDESIEALPARLAYIEKTMERFIGAGDQVRTAWLLAEAEHYMRIASAQLGLAADVDVAQTALGLADDALRELNDPRLIPVRRSLADELAALRAVPRPDVEGIVLTLAGLSGTVGKLPLRQRAPDRYQSGQAELPEGLSATERAVESVERAFRSLVSVRRAEEPVTPLLPEAEQSLLARSLDLELQLATLAIMRGDTGMYRRALDSAALRIQRYFDATSPDVRATLTTLEALSAVELADELPDISGSLAALEQVTPALTERGTGR